MKLFELLPQFACLQFELLARCRDHRNSGLWLEVRADHQHGVALTRLDSIHANREAIPH